MSKVTQVLSRIQSGDPGAAEQLLPLVYDELRELAAVRLARERPGQTLQATALVHEAYLRVIGKQDGTRSWDSLGHFFAAAAEAMRRILVEAARRKNAAIHGGGRLRLDAGCVGLLNSDTPDRLVAMSDALDRLANDDPQAAELVKLKLFAGLNIEQSAAALEISRATAYRHWTYARAWLRAELIES